MKYEKGVSTVVAEILIISITFILTLLLLNYGLQSLSGLQSGNIYLSGTHTITGNNITIEITSGTLPTPFSIVFSKGNNVSKILVMSMNKNNYSATIGNFNISIEINNYAQSDKLTAGDTIVIRNLPENFVQGSTFMIIYNNRVVMELNF